MQRRSYERGLNQARYKPDIVDRSVSVECVWLSLGWRFGLVVTRCSPDQRSCATPDPVNTRMGNRLWAGKPSRWAYVTSQRGRLSLLPFMWRYNEYQLSGWVIIIINGDGGCRLWQPVQVDSQPKSSGLVLGRRPFGAVLHSSNEPSELSQWLCHGDSTINIVLELLLLLLPEGENVWSLDGQMDMEGRTAR